MPSSSVARHSLAAALALALTPALAAERIAATPPSPEAIEAARADASRLILRAGIFDPRRQSLDLAAAGAAPDAPTRYAIVQLQPGRGAARKELAALGVEVLGYVPNNAYYVRLGRDGLSALESHPAVRWAGALRPAMKLDPSLWTASRANSAALQNDGRYEIVVEAFRGVSTARIEAALRREVPDIERGLSRQRGDTPSYLRVRVPTASLDALLASASAIDGVAFVSPWHPLRTQNAASIGAIQGQLTDDCNGSGPICGATPLFDHAITGSGQIVGLADSGTTPNAAWFVTLDKGQGPHTEITFADNPPPLPPAVGSLHPDNKIIAYWTQPGGPVDYDYASGHGTHTSGTLVGDAAGTFGATGFVPSTPWLPNHDLADGMAPNAQLLMQDIGGDDPGDLIVQDFQSTLEQAYAGGARIHSNSWGGGTSGQYTGVDADVDRATYQLEDVLVVIAAGNNQTGATAINSPGNAKNALTVAALGHGGSLAKLSLSNAGPSADGRLKPDLAAPGTDTISALNGVTVNSTVTAPRSAPNTGTSMATPVVAGNAVLLRQYFADGFYPRGFANTAIAAERLFADGFEQTPPLPPGGEAIDALHPSGAMLKAVLLNSTITTTNPSAWPNTGTGWGRPWLDGNLWFKQTLPGGDDSRRLRLFERSNAAGLATGEVDEYGLAEVAAGLEFRATLAWFDPPASPGAAATLVNNLDLEVVAPDGQVYRGNRISNGVSVPGGSADVKNTVEQVRFTAPLAGAYTLRVKGADVPGTGEAGSADRQGYALAVSGGFGLPDAPAFPAPTAPVIAANDRSGIRVDADAASGAQGFQLYRADGDCASAARADFHLVASGPTLPLTDVRSQGGFAYAYRVRGVRDDVEGEASACIDTVSQDDCALAPDFDRTSLLGSGANAACSVQLSWSAATSSCPGKPAMSYRLERDTSPAFADPQTLASGLASTEYVDSAVENARSYYYRVTAEDAAGNASLPSNRLTVTPTGPDGPDPSDFLDDVDTRSYAVLQAPWRITDSVAIGTYAYHSGVDGGTYPDRTCGALSTPPLTLSAHAALSVQARYNLEYQWDGVVQEISTDGGASWSDLPPDGGYPASFARTLDPPVNACGYPASHGAFSGVSTSTSDADPDNANAAAVFKLFTTSLAGYAGQTVQIRWRFSSDPTTAFAGLFLDQIQIHADPGQGNYTCH